MPAPDSRYRPHVGVHLILTDGGKVLLRRVNTGFAYGSWSVPGGSLDDRETLLQATAREPASAKTGTAFSGTRGGFIPAIGSANSSSSASHLKNCCRARHCCWRTHCCSTPAAT